MRNGKQLGFQRSREERSFSHYMLFCLVGHLGREKKKNGKIMPLPHALHKIDYKELNIIFFKNS